MKFPKQILPLLFYGISLAAEPLLSVEPRDLHGVPGEPMQMVLTVETADAAPVRLRVPAVSNLMVRAVERIPIRRTEDGRFVHKRIVIWQGVEAGSITLTNLTVEAGSGPLVFPDVRITVKAVEPAQPPALPESSAKGTDPAE